MSNYKRIKMFLWDPNTQMAELSPAKPQIITKTLIMIITITNTIITIMILLVTCKAAGLSAITSAACLRALLALCSPSAAITWTPAEIIIMIEIVMNT